MTIKTKRFITDFTFMFILALLAFVAGMKIRDIELDRAWHQRQMQEAGK